jgi:hypothetical protein
MEKRPNKPFVGWRGWYGVREENNEGGNMKQSKLLSYVQTVFVIPLWLGLITGKIQERRLLYYIAIGLSTLLMLINAILLIRELLVLYDAWYIFRCRRMEALVQGTRKKLQKIIAKTSDASVMDYALEKLREICPPEMYSGIIAGLAEKERNSAKKKILLTINEQIGGYK